MRREGGYGVSANEYSFDHGAQISFGDLTPYLTIVEADADFELFKKLPPLPPQMDFAAFYLLSILL
jgi:hypothetical protein